MPNDKTEPEEKRRCAVCSMPELDSLHRSNHAFVPPADAPATTQQEPCGACSAEAEGDLVDLRHHTCDDAPDPLREIAEELMRLKTWRSELRSEHKAAIFGIERFRLSGVVDSFNGKTWQQRFDAVARDLTACEAQWKAAWQRLDEYLRRMK